MRLESLGDYIVDRTESLNDELINQYFIERNDDIILRLLDSEQYVLEGSRGIGKTMLMKNAVLKSRRNFGHNSILSVWISFEESIRIERIKIVDSTIDPFLQWTMGKILNEVLREIINLKPACMDKLGDRLSSIFGTYSTCDNTRERYMWYTKLLNDYIQVLEKGDLEDNVALSKSIPSSELANVLDNPSSFKKFLLSLIDDFDLKRIVLLFDEAAHVFSHNQQEKFFTFFKSLRDPAIACKAAVYPGITNYGKYFEKGQDAKELRISWSPTNLDDIKYIKDILRKRIQSFNNDYWHKLTLDSSVIDTICICSNGNPRFTFHIIDELENSKAFDSKSVTIQKVIGSLRTVFENKWKEFDTLKQRLVKYKNHIKEAEILVKNVFTPSLRDWNNKQRKNQRKLSAGFYISTTLYDQVSKLFDILAYSNIIMTDFNKKSLGHNQYGYYVSLNPSILFADLIIRDTNEMKQVSLAMDSNKSYSTSSSELKYLLESMQVENEYHCLNSKCDFITNDESYLFCPKCGSKIEITESEALYKILRSHNIENLKLSIKIINRLNQKFSNIGELYDADIDDIKMKYIKEVRAEMVKNAAIEYMAG